MPSEKEPNQYEDITQIVLIFLAWEKETGGNNFARGTVFETNKVIIKNYLKENGFPDASHYSEKNLFGTLQSVLEKNRLISLEDLGYIDTGTIPTRPETETQSPVPQIAPEELEVIVKKIKKDIRKLKL